MAPGTLTEDEAPELGRYVVHDGKRWYIFSVYHDADGQDQPTVRWYVLRHHVPGRGWRTLHARASDCSPWVRPHRRTVKGARSDAVRLQLGRMRLDVTLGALVDLVLAARGRNKARDKALKRGRRAPV